VRTKEFYEKLGFVQIGWEYGNVDWRGRWYQKVMDPSYEMAAIDSLKDGMRHVTVEGTIVEKSTTRTVRSRKGEPLSVSHAAMNDESGTITLVLWNEQIQWVTVDDRVRVENGYVKSYRGTLQLNVGKRGRLILRDL
jgi:ssDNA-binding replication factor A large subunit